MKGDPTSWRERLADAGVLRLGTQRWDDLEPARLSRPVDIQESLREVREDASEVPRR